MRARIVKIGNSQGIRIPKPVLEQTGLNDEVEIKVENEQILIGPVRRPRSGWATTFREMAARGDDRLIDTVTPTRWEQEEWEW